MSPINLNDCYFRGVENYDTGDFNGETLFHYLQAEDIVWGTFKGGGVLIGSLVAILTASGELQMRWHYVSQTHSLKSGCCNSRPEILPDGRIRLYEQWRETDPMSAEGTSVLEQVLQQNLGSERSWF